MSREVQALVMVLLGGAVLRISIDGTFLRYVKPGFLPFLIVAGTIVLVLGLLSAWYDGLLRRTDPVPVGSDAQDGHAREHLDDGHGHGVNGPRVAWLLLLPVLAIFLVAPPALGAFTADRTTFVGEPSSSFDSLDGADPVALPVRDYVSRAVWDAGRTLEGRRVVLEGFAVAQKGKDASESGWDLARLALSCCAADALASKVRPIGEAVTPQPDEQWVRVIGTWVEGGGLDDPRAIPRIQVESIEPIDEPREPYE